MTPKLIRVAFSDFDELNPPLKIGDKMLVPLMVVEIGTDYFVVEIQDKIC